MVTAGLLLCICGLRQDTKGRRFSASDYADKQIEETLRMVGGVDIERHLNSNCFRPAAGNRDRERDE